eukprot:12499378-Alexandrium_andersonii.AAC.1
MRAGLASLRRRARARDQWGARVLQITDSLVTLGAYSKGRSSSSAVNRLCRRAAAVLVSTGIRAYWRW